MRWIDDPPTIHLAGWSRGSPEDDAKRERERELAEQVESLKAMFFAYWPEEDEEIRKESDSDERKGGR